MKANSRFGKRRAVLFVLGAAAVIAVAGGCSHSSSTPTAASDGAKMTLGSTQMTPAQSAQYDTVAQKAKDIAAQEIAAHTGKAAGNNNNNP